MKTNQYDKNTNYVEKAKTWPKCLALILTETPLIVFSVASLILALAIESNLSLTPAGSILIGTLWGKSAVCVHHWFLAFDSCCFRYTVFTRLSKQEFIEGSQQIHKYFFIL